MKDSEEQFNDHKLYYNHPLTDNSTIIPAEAMDDACSETRVERAKMIVEQLNQADEEPKSTEFPQGKLVWEYEALERENSQPVEETGDNDYPLNEGSGSEDGSRASSGEENAY